MKRLSLVLSRLIRYFKDDKVIFTVFLIGSVVCGTGFLYLYGNFTSAFLLQSETSVSGRTFTVSFSDGDDPSGEDVAKLLKESDLSFESCAVRAREEETGGNLLAVVAGEQTFTSVDGQKNFSEDEMKNGAKSVIIPSVFLTKPVGLDKEANTIAVAGVDLRIVGRNASDYDYYIPAKTFDSLGLSAESLRVVVSRRLDEKEDAAFVAGLKELFPRASVDSPGIEAQKVKSRQMTAQLILLSAVYALSIFSFMFLVKYMAERRQTENAVYRIVGCDKDTVTQLILLENVFLSSFSALLSITVYILLKRPLFDKISLQVFDYGFRDYLLCFILMVSVSLAVSVPLILKMRRHTPVTVKTGSIYA